MNIEWQNIVFEFKKYYYTELIMWIIELTVILIGLKFIRKQPSGKLFLLYLICDFVFLNIDLYLVSSQPHGRKIYANFIWISNSIISIIELIAYNFFFIALLKSYSIKRFLRILTGIYITSIIALLFWHLNYSIQNLQYIAKLFGTVGFIFLIFPCISYYYQLLNTVSYVNLLNRPSFWIICGIFFYSFISIPYYLIDTYLTENKYLYKPQLVAGLFVIPFTINFVFLIRAFLCKRDLTI